MKGNINDFNDYLTSQVGQPYLWGGQHTQLTPDNYVSVITKKESDEGNRANAIAYCKARFEAGATVLFGYDCSGLGMYWLQNVKKILSHDLNANAMMGLCEITDEPKKGYWVFRLNGEKASHIGYMVSDTEVVHAKGRAYGVVKEKYRDSYWHRIGIPSCMDFSDEPQPEPDPPEPHKYKYVKVVRKCRVRAGNGTSFKTLAIAYKNHTYPYIGQDERDPYWYMIEWNGQQAWITSNARYTEVTQ